MGRFGSVDGFWLWSLSGMGDFSVSSSRSFIDLKSLPLSPSMTNWCKLVPIKVNVFAWCLALDKLLTRKNLANRSLDVSSIQCPRCDFDIENRDHLFFQLSSF
ncbi:unnamed protein product [Lactuca virosa]|uniref:Reverse transcriptase zinc-binding domain-containing protein n=1 Tax=Lactuca virosa TaxID=75947 RepID=A0AAU9PQI1_9ASTR|nr:unnamed protein product [Lactuca virosa]